MNVMIIINRLLWCIALCLGSPLLRANPEWVDGIIVTVNNEAILLSDLKELNKKIERNDILNDIALGKWTIDDLKSNDKLKLHYLIRVKMLDAEVKRLNLRVTTDRLEAELRDIARRNKIPRDMLPAVLKEQGIAFSEYQHYLKLRLEHQALIDQEIASQIKINEEDLLALYYSKYNKKPTTSFEVELYHIFFNPKKDGLAAAKERAQQVYAQTNNADFFSLAERHSEDPHFQKQGFLGNFSKNELDPAIANAIEKYPGLGLIPEVIRSRMGYHIFYVKSRKDIPDADFLRKKDSLRAELFESRMQSAIERWFETKEKEFQIKFLKDEFKIH